MGEDKREKFTMEIVKKGLVFAAIQYDLLKFTWYRCAVGIVKLRISLYQLLENLCLLRA